MAMREQLRQFLDDSEKPYTELHHDVQTFTAQEAAGAEHVTGDCVAKPVIVEVDGQMVMCVLPASYKIDWDKLGAVVQGKKIKLADEEQLADLFPDYELGAEPPLRPLCGLPLYVDRHLADQSEIIFSAGTHKDMVQMSWEDWRDVADPTSIQDFGAHL